MAPITFWYNNEQLTFNTVGYAFSPSRFVTWGKDKVIALLRAINNERKRAWGNFFSVLSLLREERIAALHFYYIIKNRDQIDDVLCNISLKRYGLILNVENKMACGICNKTMEILEEVSMVSTCGHCAHSKCLEDDYKNTHKCGICKQIIDYVSIVSLVPRDDPSFLQRIMKIFTRE